MTLSIWDEFSQYESSELVKRDYKDRHGRDLNLRHAREITAAFSHARSYFRSTKNSEPTVKPLLLYYGVVSLSRGLALLLTRGMREAALAQSHGLSAKNWQHEMSHENPDFGKLRVVVNASGSFIDLGKATNYKSLLRHGSSAANLVWTNDASLTGLSFTLGDILSRLPALQSHYRLWGGEALCLPATWKVEDKELSENEVRLYFSNSFFKSSVRSIAERLLPMDLFTFEEETDQAVTFRGPKSSEVLPGITDVVEHSMFGIGDIWLTARYNGQKTMSKIMTLFSVSYILGMLVRYYPTQWTALIRSQIEDAALPALSYAVDIIEREFPQLVLDFLKPLPQG